MAGSNTLERDSQRHLFIVLVPIESVATILVLDTSYTFLLSRSNGTTHHFPNQHSSGRGLGIMLTPSGSNFRKKSDAVVVQNIENRIESLVIGD